MYWPCFETWQPFCMKLLKAECEVNLQKGRRRIQMLHDLANDDGYVALKRAAEDRERWKQRKGVETCSTADDYWWWLCILLCVSKSWPLLFSRLTDHRSMIQLSDVSKIKPKTSAYLAFYVLEMHNNWRALWKNRIYWYISFFRPSLSHVLFPMFCLLVEGECQILVFYILLVTFG